MKQGQKLAGVTRETPGAKMDEYSIPTPYGTVTITRGGRRITYDLFPDVRQSRHSVALFSYVEQLIKSGVTRFNADHISMLGRDRTLSLTRGKAKLDLVYYQKKKFYECELKTSREIGLDVTAIQLTELCRHVDDLTLLVPGGRLEEADTICKLINIRHQVTLVPYDGVGDDENGE